MDSTFYTFFLLTVTCCLLTGKFSTCLVVEFFSHRNNNGVIFIITRTIRCQHSNTKHRLEELVTRVCHDCARLISDEVLRFSFRPFQSLLFPSDKRVKQKEHIHTSVRRGKKDIRKKSCTRLPRVEIHPTRDRTRLLPSCLDKNKHVASSPLGFLNQSHVIWFCRAGKGEDPRLITSLRRPCIFLLHFFYRFMAGKKIVQQNNKSGDGGGVLCMVPSRLKQPLTKHLLSRCCVPQWVGIESST